MGVEGNEGVDRQAEKGRALHPYNRYARTKRQRAPPPLCTKGAAVGVMSSGRPHQSQDLQTCSCGLMAWPRPCASCLTVHHCPCVSDTVVRCGACSTACG